MNRCNSKFHFRESSRPWSNIFQGCGEHRLQGFYAWRETPPTRSLIRKEDAANLIRLNQIARSKDIASMIASAPARPDDVELTKVRGAINELLGRHWVATRGIRVDKVQLYWIVQEEPHCERRG